MYSAFIITHNRAEKLLFVLDGILKQSISPSKIFVVDNASNDNSLNILSSYDQNKIKVLRSKANIGHCAGLALAFNYYLKNNYKDEYIMLFEDDSVADGFLANYMLMHIQKSGYDFLALDGFNMQIGQRIKPELNPKLPVSIDFALLDGCIFHSSLLKRVGLPIQNWFMMYDDVEYSYRIRKSGLKIGAVKNIHHEIEHIGAKTSKWRAYYQTRNHLHFVKMYPTLENILDFIFLEGKRLIGSIGSEIFSLRWKGLVDGFKGIYGRSLEPF